MHTRKRQHWWVGLWLGLCACDAPSDQERYLDAITKSRPTDFSACEAIQTADLKGDCQLALAGRMHLASWCAEIDSEPWRGECWFMAAEGARDAQKWALAIQYCQSAGPFVDSCNRHLWQPYLDRQLQKHRGQDFTASLAMAEALYQSWLPALGSDFTQQFWFNYARSVFRGAPNADISWCQQLAVAYRADCQGVYRRLQASPPSSPPQRPQASGGRGGRQN